MIVPPGSKIATSRINFKLLAREAAERRMNVVAVSDEPQVRALAISAGLPAYDSTTTAEQALATFQEQDRRLSERIRRTMPREHPDPKQPGGGSGQTLILPVAAKPQDTRSPVPIDTAVLPAQQAAAGRRGRSKRRVPIAPLIVLGLGVLLIAGVAYGTYVLLPTASITLRPAAVTVHPPAFTVTADPAVAVTDTDQGVIPAQQISVPIYVSGTFNATGIDAHDTRASGSVRFRSENTLNAVPIPAGTVVSTTDGVDFMTADDTVVPKASFATGPTQVDVDVHAVKGGIRGNVDAGAISVVPQSLSSQLITVTNPDAIAGGKHVEDQVVTQEDYDAALASLSSQLQTALTGALADPLSVPRGLIPYPDTAQLTAGQPDQPAADVVGTVAPTFTLALDSTADLTAVNESLIDDVASARLAAALGSGQKLVTDDVSASHDGGTIAGDTIVYSVNASGMAYANPDPQVVVAVVKGKSLVEARTALATYGAADISVWPDFVDHLPDQASRISVSIAVPSPLPTSSPTPLPTSSPAPVARATADDHATVAVTGTGRVVTRLLGVDLGTRRIGLAVGDTTTGSVVPLTTIRRSEIERDAGTISNIAREQRVDELVVGLPLNMDGSEGAQASDTRVWAAHVAELAGLPVRWRDERLTTEAAIERIGQPPRGKSGGPPSAAARRAYRARLDRMAAAAIVQAEVDGRRASDETAVVEGEA